MSFFDQSLYLHAPAAPAPVCTSCGNLQNAGGFVHPRRRLDHFVLILVLHGTLFLTQDETVYTVRQNEFLLLLPHALHYGTRPSEGALSYYWAHFYFPDGGYEIAATGKYPADSSHTLGLADALPHTADAIPLSAREHCGRMAGARPAGKHFCPAAPDMLLLPVCGRLSAEKRAVPLFSQLLDTVRRSGYVPSCRWHYALASLLLELTDECAKDGRRKSGGCPPVFYALSEYLRTHYDEPLTVAGIAARFGYSPTYLTRLCKRCAGLSLLQLLNETRLAVAKNLLCATPDPVFLIAKSCGFENEKYFMRLFKKREGVTPGRYRQAFAQRRVNRE